MYAAVRIDPERLHQPHLAAGRQIEPAALLDDCAHHCRMGQRLERVVQLHARQGCTQLAKLGAHTRAVDDQQWGAELAYQSLNLIRLERINATQGRMPTAIESSTTAWLSDSLAAAARRKRSRTASQRSSAG